MRYERHLTISAGLMLGAVAQGAPADYAPKVGQRHPDFILPRINDRPAVALSDFRGKKVLLIHFASW